MRAAFRSSLRTRQALICAVIGAGLVFSYSVLAPPARGVPPKKPAKRPPARPGPKPGTVRPSQPKHPPAKAKPLRRAGRYKRYVRRPRYWQPHYRVKTPPTIWRDIGYRYYVGGTGYVAVPTVVPVEAGEAPAPPAEGPAEEEELDTYVQIQELVELVHEWRTMNESPSVHQRLPSAGAPAELAEVIAEIRKQNHEFDKQTRAAMRKLAGGESAESELESARASLEKVMELVESLPPGREGRLGPAGEKPLVP